MKKSSQIALKIVPLRHFFPLKVVPLIEVLLYLEFNQECGCDTKISSHPMLDLGLCFGIDELNRKFMMKLARDKATEKEKESPIMPICMRESLLTDLR
jgi:hypothetical protein